MGVRLAARGAANHDEGWQLPIEGTRPHPIRSATSWLRRRPAAQDEPSERRRPIGPPRPPLTLARAPISWKSLPYRRHHVADIAVVVCARCVNHGPTAGA